MKIAPRSVAVKDEDGSDLVFTRGDGPLVYDARGREYVDFVCGFGPVVLGHAYPGFFEEVSRLAAASIHLPGNSVLHRDLVASLPMDDSAAAGFFKSSSESVAAATRLARLRTGREAVIQAGFIGWLDGQIAPGIAWHRPLATRGSSPEPLVWSDLDLGSLRARLQRRDIACLVLDAYQCVFNEDSVCSFLSEVQTSCREAGTLFVLDETKTSGRVGRDGIWPLLDFDPDLIVLGKALANGLPLSILIDVFHDRDSYLEARVGGTYSKETVSVAGALVTRRILKSEGGIERLQRIGTEVCTRLNAVIGGCGRSGELSFVPRFGGAMFDLDFMGRPEDEKRLLSALTHAGLLMLTPHPNFVMLAHESVVASGLLESRFAAALKVWGALTA